MNSLWKTVSNDNDINQIVISIIAWTYDDVIKKAFEWFYKEKKNKEININSWDYKKLRSEFLCNKSLRKRIIVFIRKQINTEGLSQYKDLWKELMRLDTTNNDTIKDIEETFQKELSDTLLYTSPDGDFFDSLTNTKSQIEDNKTKETFESLLSKDYNSWEEYEELLSSLLTLDKNTIINLENLENIIDKIPLEEYKEELVNYINTNKRYLLISLIGTILTIEDTETQYSIEQDWEEYNITKIDFLEIAQNGYPVAILYNGQWLSYFAEYKDWKFVINTKALVNWKEDDISIPHNLEKTNDWTIILDEDEYTLEYENWQLVATGLTDNKDTICASTWEHY